MKSTLDRLSRWGRYRQSDGATGRLTRLTSFGPKKSAALGTLASVTLAITSFVGDDASALLLAPLALVVLGTVLSVLQVHRQSDRSRGSNPSEAAALSIPKSARPVVAGMASIPSRIAALEQAVTSVNGQVDRIHVYLNGYSEIPSFLQSTKITVHRSQEHGDLKDNGKFFGLTQCRSGTYFTLDDDIVYPPDYVSRLTKTLERTDYRCIVGVHGVYYSQRPSSFFNRKVIRYWDANQTLRPVSLLGTGTVAFSVNSVRFAPSDLKTTGIADVWLAKYAKANRIPMLIVPRSAGWLKDAEVPINSKRIWLDTKRNHRVPTEVIYNHHPWGLEDLFTRTNDSAVSLKLPKGWRQLRAFYDVFKASGGERAVAELPDDAKISGYVALYFEPSDALAVAESALRMQGQRSPLFRRSVVAGAKHDPLTSARLLEEAVCEAVDSELWDDAAWLSSRASRFYRNAGKLAAASRVLEKVAGNDEDAAELRAERISLAIDRRDYEMAWGYLVSAPFDPQINEAERQLRLAQVVAHNESVATAAPWIVELFMNPAGRSRQSRLVSLVRNLPPCTQLSGEFPFRLLEGACMSGAIDPVPTLHLYLAAGDRDGARRLLDGARRWIGSAYGEDLLWLEAAAASSTDELMSRINKALASRGVAELELSGEPEAHFLSRLGGTVTPGERAESVSVIMSAYNCAGTLGYALDSVRHQSVNPLEIIVVDDCSEDGTSESIAEVASRDERVIHLRTDRNAGPYVCRNLALASARGDYLAIQDSDDYAHPQRLAYQLELLRDQDVVACYVGHVRMSPDGILVPDNHGELIGEGPMTLMMKRSVFQELGYFQPIRSRGDIEHRDRMTSFYGAHRVLLDRTVLLLAEDSLRSNSRVFDADVARTQEVRQLKAEARRRIQSARGRREQLYVGSEIRKLGIT